MTIQEENSIEKYMEYGIEELEAFLENPQDIETGCGRNCDLCLEEETGLIKEALRRKELKDEHLRDESQSLFQEVK